MIPFFLQVTLYFTLPDKSNEADAEQSKCGPADTTPAVAGSETNHMVLVPEALSLVTHV